MFVIGVLLQLFLVLTCAVAFWAARSIWARRHVKPFTPTRLALALIAVAAVLAREALYSEPDELLALAGGTFCASVAWLINSECVIARD